MDCKLQESAVRTEALLRGGGGSEPTDSWGCAILAPEVVPKNVFYKILCLLFQQENYPSLLIYQVKMASGLLQVAKIN